MEIVKPEKWQRKFKKKPTGRPPMPLKERFELHVDKTKSCWLWTGHKQRQGYGTFKFDYKKSMAHRISYELYIGEIPEGLVIDHLCRIRHCVNPEHLEPVTANENLKRRPPFMFGGKLYYSEDHYE